MESTRPCPNCNNPASADAALCPHCGAILPPTAASAVWPPPPSNSPPPAPFVQKLVTASESGDVTLGIGVTVLICIFGGIGLVASPILYFMLRPSAPFFARGIGYGFLVGAALLFGALAVCFYGVS